GLLVRAMNPDAQQLWDLAFSQVVKGDARIFDVALRHRSGRPVILQHALYPIRDAQGRVRIIEGTARDLTTVRQLEELKARNEEGRLELRPVRIDVREAVQDAIAALHDRIASRALTLRVELGPVPLMVRGDRGRLMQVFRALIGNAEKFSENKPDRSASEI